MASATCRYSSEWRPLGYAKWPFRSAPVRRSKSSTSSRVGISCKASMGSFAQQNVRDRPQDDVPIQCQRPSIDVLHVELHPCFEIQLVAPVYGPQASEPGTHPQAPSLPPLVFLHLLGDGWPRADE